MNEKRLKIILFILMIILLGFGLYTAYLDNGPRKLPSQENTTGLA